MANFRFLFAVIVYSWGNLFAGDQPDWNDGVIVLADETVLKGQMIIHLKHDLVLFRAGDEVTVFPAHKIRQVLFYDPQDNINRKYVSLSLPERRFNKYQLFEIVLWGKVMVVRMEKLFSNGGTSRDYHYFTLFNGQVIQLNHFKRKVFPQLREAANAFVTQEGINLNSMAGALRFIKLYNRFSEVSSNSVTKRSRAILLLE